MKEVKEYQAKLTKLDQKDPTSEASTNEFVFDSNDQQNPLSKEIRLQMRQGLENKSVFLTNLKNDNEIQFQDDVVGLLPE